MNLAAEPGPLEEIVRLAEPDFHMSYPFDVFARMRREAPLYWSPSDRMWAVTKYEDVRQISKSPQLFSNRFGLLASHCRIADDGAPAADDPVDGMPMCRRAALRGEALGREMLVSTDPPRHAFLRKIASYAFTPKAIAHLEEHVAGLAVTLLDQIEPGVEMDFVDAIAAPVPMRVIAEMLGVPTERLDDFRRWSDALIELGSNTESKTEKQFNEYATAALEFAQFFTDELKARVDDPRDDLLTALAHADDDGKPLDLESQLGTTFVLLTAGNETTRALIANAAKLLFDHPEQRALLAQDLALMPNAIEELLRYQPPVTHMCRTALADTELRGQKIARGDYLVMLYAAANHDEDVWERAGELDITRKPDPSHLAFGFAEHYCLGAQLARREARLVLSELLKRFPNYELMHESERMRAEMTPGFQKLRVVFHR